MTWTDVYQERVKDEEPLNCATHHPPSSLFTTWKGRDEE